MIVLKKTEDYRVDTELEVKNLNEQLQKNAVDNGYKLSSFSYTKKEKKSKGEVIDECYLVRASMIYESIWGD